MTDDRHPIHYDEYAEAPCFGTRVAHGILATALIAVETSNVSPLLAGSISAFVKQSARSLKPVLVGDAILPEIEVTELTPKTDMGLVK